ncbi:MAG: GIY-YIG nuclease family protein [Promethearchaeota archaeon]
MKGAYILIIHVGANITIDIGALGPIEFKRGFYAYVGSAMGERGSSTLENRVLRHLLPSNVKKIHWHVDYLLAHEKTLIIRIYLIPSSEKLECMLAREIKKKSDFIIKKFGSSDCSCESHLFHFKTLDSLFKK